MFKNKFSKADKAAKKQAQQPVFKQDYFNNCHRTYSCIHCRAHLANHDELISKLFQGNQGRAYLFNKVVNIGCKQAVQRELLTGLHAVADIYCDNCETTLGWKYEQAFVPSQKYKEGKYIIELVHMLKENDWDLTSYNARELLRESNSINDLNLINSYKVGDNYIGPPNKYKLFSNQLKRDDKNKGNGNGNSNSARNTCNDEDRMFTFQSRDEAITSAVATTAISKNISLGKQIPDVKSGPPILGSQNEKSVRIKNKTRQTEKAMNEDDEKLEKENIELPEKSNSNGNRMHASITTTDNLNLLSASSKNSLSSSRSQSDISSYVSITDNSTGGSISGGSSNNSSRAYEDSPYELCPVSQSNILRVDVKILDTKLSSSSSSPTRDTTSETNRVLPLARETGIKVGQNSIDQLDSSMNTSVL